MGEDLVASSDEGTDQQPAVRLDADYHRSRLLRVLGDEGMQFAYALQAFGNPSPCQHLARFVDQADVVVGFRPIDSDKDHWRLLCGHALTPSQGESRRANRAVLKAQHPTGRPSLLTSRWGHSLALELRGSADQKCSPTEGSDETASSWRFCSY